MSLVETHLKIIIKLCTAHLFLVQTLGDKWREPPKPSTFPIRIYYESSLPLSLEALVSQGPVADSTEGPATAPSALSLFYSAQEKSFSSSSSGIPAELNGAIMGAIECFMTPGTPRLRFSLSQVHGLWLILLQISPFFLARGGRDSFIFLPIIHSRGFSSIIRLSEGR